jgi:hypothetical protein
MRAIRISVALLGLVALLGTTGTPTTGDTGETPPDASADTGVPTTDTTDTTNTTNTTNTSDTSDTSAARDTAGDTGDTGAGAADTPPTDAATDDTGPVALATGLARERGGVGCATSEARGLGALLVSIVAIFAQLRRRGRRSAAASLAALALLSPGAAAWAVSPPDLDPEEAPRSEVHLILRGVVERWNDPAITTVYRSGTWLAGAGLVVDLLGPLGVDVEVGFGRLQGEQATLEIAPLSALIELTAPLGRADGFLAAGPAWTVFTESGGGDVVDGARISAELRGGVRVDTGLVQPPAAPAPSTFDRMELELYFARRAELPGPGRGLQLGAWRASVGLGVVF